MTETQAAILLADLALIVVMSRAAGSLAQRLGQPAVIGEIVAGVVVGPSLFHGTVAHTLFPTEIRPYLGALANLGLVLFMFVVGLEFDFGRLRGSGRVAGATMVGATLLPFACGSLLALHLAQVHRPANRLGFVLFVGVAMSVTAFPVLARIIAERGMNHSVLGAVALSSAAVCDLVAWTMLAVVQAVVGGGNQQHWMTSLVVPYVIILVVGVRPLLHRWLAAQDLTGSLSASSLAVVLTGVLVSAATTQLLGLHFVFGAFLFGLVTPRRIGTTFRDELLTRTQLATTLLLPVYFIVAGLNVDLHGIGFPGLSELGLIIVVAVAAKFVGAWIGARTQGLSGRQSAVLATLMNTRGLTELVALSVGQQIGVLDGTLYSLMVVMAVVTTAMTGPLLRWLAGQPEPEDAALSSTGVSPSRPRQAGVLPAAPSAGSPGASDRPW